MLFWNAKIGYCPLTATDSRLINYSDVTWTDDTLFGVAQLSSPVADFDETELTPEEVYNFSYSIVGEQLNTVYVSPVADLFPSSLHARATLNQYYPSIFKGIPNGYAIAETHDYGWIMYVESLGVGFVSSRPAGYVPQGYGVKLRNGVFDGRGTTAAYSYLRCFGTLSGSTPRTIFFNTLCCINYETPEDLLNPDKMRRMGVTFGYYSDTINQNRQLGTFEVKTPYESSLTFVFGGEDGKSPSPPDGHLDPTDPDNPFENPYAPGGESGEGDPIPGTFDDESDPIDIPPLPTLSSSNTGFTRIYNPSLSQVQALAQYLWTDESVVQTIWNHIKQYFEDPMQAIIGFNLLPVPVPNGGTTTFKLMYIDTGVSMTAAANQFVDVDCGTLLLEQYYGSALDFSPYTKVSCYLPYVGNVNLNVDEVMGKEIHIKYRVDICSGSCVAYILVDESVLYQYSGHCAIPIPFSSADFSSYVTAGISTAKLVGSTALAGAGVGAVEAATEPLQQTSKTTTTATSRNPTTGRQRTEWTSTVVKTIETPPQSNTQASFSGLSAQNIANTVGQVVSSKPFIEHSGSFFGNSGYLGVRRPFLIIERPNMCMPADYQVLNGFPSMITMKLSTCKGFTKVQQVQLTGMPATNPEQAEILELLKSGVVF